MPPVGNNQPAPENKEGNIGERQPRWTEDEIENGEDILHYIKKKIDTNRVEDRYAQASIAAQALNFISKNQTFKDLPSGIKSYLSYVWRLNSSIHLPNEEEWFREVDPHILHPEDETHIIDALKNKEE